MNSSKFPTIDIHWRDKNCIEELLIQPSAAKFPVKNAICSRHREAQDFSKESSYSIK
jgi:hypothetical protein